MDSAVTWLLTPLSGSAEHSIAGWTSWHARMMVLAWTILLPTGMFIARFYKIHPRQDWPTSLDSKFWWRTHVATQIAGVVVMCAGLGIAWGRGAGATEPARLHHALGWTVAAIAAIQVIAGAFRGTKGGPGMPETRGDHYDMTRRRLLFEWVHKHLGWLAVPTAAAATAIGLVMADAPRWMPVAIGLWWVCFLALFAVLQRAGWCVDTYQAIWGADAAHPGNQRRPIGLGVKRRTGGP